MSSPIYSNISQNNAEVLEKQQQEIQQRHKEEQWLLVQLEDAMKSYWAEHVAQKTRKEAEAKAREEAKKRMVAEEEKKKKRTLEYLQQLQNKMLKEDTALLEGT